MPVFRGARLQRGYGIGSIFSGLFRSIFPVLKRVATVIGKKVLQTGTNIVNDVAAGQSPKESAKSRLTDALRKGISSFIPMGNTQLGSGYRRKRKHSKKPKTSKKKKIKRHTFVMAVIFFRSCLCVKSELDLFIVPPMQTSVEHGCIIDYHLILMLTDNGPIEFNIPGSGEDFINLANTFLLLGVKITAADRANIADAAAIEPVNLLIHSLQPVFASQCCILRQIGLIIDKQVFLSGLFGDSSKLWKGS